MNSCLVRKGLDKIVQRELITVPANRLAREIGEERAANMVLLGAYLARNRFLKMDSIRESLREFIGKKGERLLALNYRALELGANI